MSTTPDRIKVGLDLPTSDRTGLGWSELRDIAMLAEDRRLRFHLARRPSSLPHERRGRAQRQLGILVDAVGPGRLHQDGRARQSGAGHGFPQPGAVGQDGRHRRRDQRWTPDSGGRHGIPRGRIQRLRLSLRPPLRPVRGSDPDRLRTLEDRRGRLRRSLLQGARMCAQAARTPAHGPADHGRHERPQDAQADRALCRYLECLLDVDQQQPRWRATVARASRRGLRRGRA